MSDFDVVDDDMLNRGLSDTDIEALIAGAPVAGASAPLTDLLGSLRQRAATTPTVPVSGALSEFIVGRAPATASAAKIAPYRRPAVATRRPSSLLARASALLGLVPAYVLIGATAAAAAVGGAHLLGFVDVPFLPDRGHHVETPAPTPPAPGAVVPPVVAEPETASSKFDAGDHSTATSAVPEPPTSQRPEPAVPALPGPADTNATTVGCGPATTYPAGPPTSQVATHSSLPASACEPQTPVSTSPAGPGAPPNSSQTTTPPNSSQAGQPTTGPNPEGRTPDAVPSTIGQPAYPQEATPSTSATNPATGRTP